MMVNNTRGEGGWGGEGGVGWGGAVVSAVVNVDCLHICHFLLCGRHWAFPLTPISMRKKEI